MAKQLRSGYTTGACAAAAGKAAVMLLLNREIPSSVDIPFPDNTRHSFSVIDHGKLENGGCWAAIVKDAGDDPDVTNRARIRATAYETFAEEKTAGCLEVANVFICGGKGVGRATKPGLAVKVGEPAINPVPRQMIAEAIGEVSRETRILVEISIDNGEILAKKTLNHRLGIVGGLSILGTTGIVRPVSTSAWTATISASMAVARAAGLDDIVLSTGRTSETGAQQFLDLPEEAYAMTGDYLHFSLSEAAKKGFTTIHLAGMWAKITKAALKIPQTHVRNGALEIVDAARLMERCGASGDLLNRIRSANTAREMLEHILAAGRTDIIRAVCCKAREYGREVSACEVKVYLITSRKEILERV